MLGSEEPQTIRTLEEALRLPFLDLPESVKQGRSRLTQMDITQAANFPRVKLLYHLAKVDERLQSRHRELMSGASEEEARPASPDDHRARANESARCQASLAVTVLGRSWYNEKLGSDGEAFDQVREHAATLDIQKDRSWLARLGDHLAARWVGMVDEIVSQVEKPRPQLSQAERIAGLRKADAMCRLLDGPAADLLERHLLPQHHPRALKSSITRTQLASYRRVLIRSVLLNQARRVLDDHWSAEGVLDKEPYYRAAALACLDDAAKVDPLQFAPATEVTELAEKVTRSPDGLRSRRARRAGRDGRIDPGSGNYSAV